ncbi:MAG: SEC-C metal-binding domain-containing protein [Agitococcus sp.]|nr:SEC-C metal-binding domain-containing protein [Agitococcus sp.]MDO9177018.1 SEC-C metal-binding domain-containing protein [Agitococcus sp.]
MNFSTIYSNIRSTSALSQSKKQLSDINAEYVKLKDVSTKQLTQSFQQLRSEPLAKRTHLGFAIVKEVTSRVIAQEQYDVQLLGGLTLLKGQLAEMRTGEGKTLTIVAPAAILALNNNGVHVITANEYLAERDANLMRPIYEALGLSVAYVHASQTTEEKKLAYASDVTYGISAEFGFDFLKDNLVLDGTNKVQRKLYAAIVDEIDFVLIDEARIPLIIAGNGEDISGLVEQAKQAIEGLDQHDVILDLTRAEASLTEEGYKKVEQKLLAMKAVVSEKSIYARENLYLIRCIHAAVKAKYLFKKGRDYLLENNSVMLIDVGTGRKMEGRRLEDGLHEAIEAQEGLSILPGSMTQATITFQNYFSQYSHLSGLTGTAATEAEEFAEVYGLRTVTLPTNKPIKRTIEHDVVFSTKFEKFKAAVARIQEIQASGQPVLVGCASVRDAQVLSTLLHRSQVKHLLLSAQHKEQEAHIIANAGKLGQVTVATNMAGRGTDIILGGEPPREMEGASEAEFQKRKDEWQLERKAVLATGGLRILGTERNGIRRVDNQLAGRCGRQGEVGQVQFFLSLEDDLLRNFAKSKQLAIITAMMAKAGGALSGGVVSRLIEAAQQKQEKQGFDARKALLGFDSVLGEQRTSVYELRDFLLGDDAEFFCDVVAQSAVTTWIATELGCNSVPETWDLRQMKDKISHAFGVNTPLIKWVTLDNLEKDEITQLLTKELISKYHAIKPTKKEQAICLLTVISEIWTEHLTALDELRRAMDLKVFSGLNPVFQFRNDAYKLFEHFEAEMQSRFLTKIMLQGLNSPTLSGGSPPRVSGPITLVSAALANRWVTRNELCPCQSGKPYKRCHGVLK